MRGRVYLLFLVALVLTVITVPLALFSVAVWVDAVRSFILYGYTAGGKELIYLPIFPILTFFFARWSRGAWTAWNRSRQQLGNCATE